MLGKENEKINALLKLKFQEKEEMNVKCQFSVDDENNFLN